MPSPTSCATSTPRPWSLSADGSTLAWQQFVSGGRKDDHVRLRRRRGDRDRREGARPRTSACSTSRPTGWSSAPGSGCCSGGRPPAEQRTVVRKAAGSASIEHDLLASTPRTRTTAAARSWCGSATRERRRLEVLPGADRGLLPRRHAAADLPHPHRRPRPRRDPPARARRHEARDLDDELVQRRGSGSRPARCCSRSTASGGPRPYAACSRSARTPPTRCRCRRPSCPGR